MTPDKTVGKKQHKNKREKNKTDLRLLWSDGSTCYWCLPAYWFFTFDSTKLALLPAERMGSGMTEQRESVPSFCSFRANKLHGNDLLLIGIKEPSEVDRWLLTSCFTGKPLNDFLLVVVTQLYRDIIIQNELTGLSVWVISKFTRCVCSCGIAWARKVL